MGKGGKGGLVNIVLRGVEGEGGRERRGGSNLHVISYYGGNNKRGGDCSVWSYGLVGGGYYNDGIWLNMAGLMTMPLVCGCLLVA